jgi:hypothetical protein
MMNSAFSCPLRDGRKSSAQQDHLHDAPVRQAHRLEFAELPQVFQREQVKRLLSIIRFVGYRYLLMPTPPE